MIKKIVIFIINLLIVVFKIDKDLFFEKGKDTPSQKEIELDRENIALEKEIIKQKKTIEELKEDVLYSGEVLLEKDSLIKKLSEVNEKVIHENKVLYERLKEVTKELDKFIKKNKETNDLNTKLSTEVQKLLDEIKDLTFDSSKILLFLMKNRKIKEVKWVKPTYRVSKNFVVSEFMDMNDKMYVKIDLDLLDNLQKFREWIRKELFINTNQGGGFRTKSTNIIVKGHRDSRHTYGEVVDTIVNGWSMEYLAKKYEEFTNAGKGNLKEIGTYPGHVHVGYRKKWFKFKGKYK